MVQVKKLKQNVLSQVPVYHHHGDIVLMKPRVSVAVVIRENVACSGGNGYKGGTLS